MMNRILVLALALVALFAVTALATPYNQHPRHPTATSSATNADPAFIPIRLALKQHQSHVDHLLAELDAVSSPSSRRYGQHLSVEEIGAIIGHSDKDLTHIKHWLATHPHIRGQNIHVHTTRDYIDVTLPAAVAREMVGDGAQRQRDGIIRHGLHGRYASHVEAQKYVAFAFYLSGSHIDRIRTRENRVSEFAGLKRLSTRKERAQKRMRRQRKQQKQLAKKNGGRVVPQHHRTATGCAPDQTGQGTPNNQLYSYDVPPCLTGTNPNNSVLVWGTGTYGFAATDLESYYSQVNVSANEINLLHVVEYEGTPGGDNFGEGTLDISLISALAPGITAYVSNTDTSYSAEEGDGFGPAMLAWLSGIIQNATVIPLPGVISLSLGSLSWDSCNLLCEGVAANGQYNFTQCYDYMQQQRQVCMYPDSDEMDRMHLEFAKIGLLGTTVMAATGDGGSHFSFQFFNTDPIGTILNQVACAANFPTFPAESPFVLGVGGTQWATPGSFTPIAWGSSGGGFSWRFARPSYQDAALNNYFSVVTMPPATAYNRSNRAYPDVATLAQNVPVVTNGMMGEEAGTSCAAPEFSALMALINDARLNAGYSKLGFINPVLYKLSEDPSTYSQIFVDMSVGNSDCDVNGQCCNQGTAFQAAVGWDPTTGLGSPLFGGLLEHLGDNEFLKRYQ